MRPSTATLTLSAGNPVSCSRRRRKSRAIRMAGANRRSATCVSRASGIAREMAPMLAGRLGIIWAFANPEAEIDIATQCATNAILLRWSLLRCADGEARSIRANMRLLSSERQKGFCSRSTNVRGKGLPATCQAKRVVRPFLNAESARLLQSSLNSCLRLLLRHDPLIRHGHLAPRDSFRNRHSLSLLPIRLRANFVTRPKECQHRIHRRP